MTGSPETQPQKESYEDSAFWLWGTFSGTDLKYQDFHISRTWRSDLSLFNLRLFRGKKMWEVQINNKTTHMAENMKYWKNIKSIVHFVEIIYIHQGCVWLYIDNIGVGIFFLFLFF